MAEHSKEMKLGRHGLFYQTDETIDLEPAEQIQAFLTDAKSTGVRQCKLLELKNSMTSIEKNGIITVHRQLAKVDKRNCRSSADK